MLQLGLKWVTLPLIFIFTFFDIAYAGLSGNNLKNISKILKNDYKHLSPIHGALLSTHHGLQWTYIEGSHYKDQKGSNIGNLVSYLFFLNNDGINFNYSQSKESALAFLQFKDIGTILGQKELYKNKKVPENEYVNPFSSVDEKTFDWSKFTRLKSLKKEKAVRKFIRNRFNRFKRIVYETTYENDKNKQVNFNSAFLAYLWQRSDSIESLIK